MYAAYNYAVCLGIAKRYPEAANELQQLFKTRRRALGPSHIDTLFTAWRLIEYSRLAGDKATARDTFDEVYANANAIKKTKNWRRAGSLAAVGEASIGIGRDKQVAEILKAAYDIYDEAASEGDREIAATNLNSWAWTLATSPLDELRDGKKAVALATKACEQTNFNDANIVDTLAAAYAEAGDFDAAVKWSQKSLELIGEGRGSQRATFEAALKRYQAQEPTRRTPPEAISQSPGASPSVAVPAGKAGTEEENSTSTTAKEKNDGEGRVSP
jgi:tetratricopeptide (TPR) repeat protein